MEAAVARAHCLRAPEATVQLAKAPVATTHAPARAMVPGAATIPSCLTLTKMIADADSTLTKMIADAALTAVAILDAELMGGAAEVGLAPGNTPAKIGTLPTSPDVLGHLDCRGTFHATIR